MVDIWLPYGVTEVCVRVPSENLLDIVKSQYKAGVENPEENVKRSIRNPIGSKRLSEMIKPSDRVALALNMPDLTLVKLTIPLIIEEIFQSGIKSDNLTVLLADDPFLLKTPDFLNHIRDEISSIGVNVSIHNHSASDSILIEDAEGKIKVYLNKEFAEASIKVLLSIFEPNPYTLYSCGDCAIVLGLSNMETVESVLMPSLNAEDLGETVLKNIFGISRIVNVDFSLNIVRNIKGEIVGSFAGKPKETFLEGSKLVDSLFKVQIEEKADIIVISPGGTPFDKNLFNACRCLENALKAVKKSGTIVLIAECLEGCGNKDMQENLERMNGDIDSLEKDLRKKFSVSGFITYRFLRALKKAEVIMASAIPDYYANKIQIKVFRAANKALKHALDKSDRKSKVLAILHGNLIIPAIKESIVK